DSPSNPKYIIVLATEKRDATGRFPDFEQDRQEQREIYVGGNIRMLAALEAVKKYPNAEFIMVGGYATEGEKVSSKAIDMEAFMRENYPDLNLKIISSRPSTNGNLE